MISDGGGGVGGGNYWSSVDCCCWSGGWGRSNGMANALAAAYCWASLQRRDLGRRRDMVINDCRQHRRRLAALAALAVAAGKAAVGGWSALVVAVLLNLCLWRRLWRRLRDMVINDMIGNHMPCEGNSDDVAFSWLISSWLLGVMDRRLLILLAKSGLNIQLHDQQLGDEIHRYIEAFLSDMRLPLENSHAEK